MTIRELWKRITTTRYAHAIEEEILPHMRLQEAEIARLRAENRALLNSILGIAGIPPIVVAVPPESLSRASEHGSAAVGAQHVVPAVASASVQPQARHAVPLQDPQPGDPGHAHLAGPTRRRSWQQIHRAFEFAALQKRKPSEGPLT